MANSGKSENSRTSALAGTAGERPGTMTMSEMTFSLGPFRLLPRQRRLLQEDRPVALCNRAAVVELAGELPNGSCLEARAWFGITAEESNLRAQITVLRRIRAQGAIGANYVVTVKGRGYRFVSPVAQSSRRQVAYHCRCRVLSVERQWRAYALDRLSESGGFSESAPRHAQYQKNPAGD
jgi:DNA-binding winged helix-turn-helix (wHTH) protein